MPKVALVMGSKSDLPQLTGLLRILREFGVEVDVQVISAHRSPHRAMEYASGAENAGFEVIIAAAGKAAHLPGVLAACTLLPVIGIPIRSSLMDGLDSLLSIVQMPTGVPVATVAVNGGDNAALLAVQIMAGKYPELREKLRTQREKMTADVGISSEQARIEVKELLEE